MEITTEKMHMLWNEPTTIVERVLFNEKYWTFKKGGSKWYGIFQETIPRNPNNVKLPKYAPCIN